MHALSAVADKSLVLLYHMIAWLDKEKIGAVAKHDILLGFFYIFLGQDKILIFNPTCIW